MDVGGIRVGSGGDATNIIGRLVSFKYYSKPLNKCFGGKAYFWLYEKTSMDVFGLGRHYHCRLFGLG